MIVVSVKCSGRAKREKLLAHPPRFFRRPNPANHVALDANRVAEQVAVLVGQFLEQAFEGRTGVVVVDQRRGLWIRPPGPEGGTGE